MPLLVLSVVAHGNLLHLWLNVDAWLGVAGRLEAELGTVQLVWTTVLLGAAAQAIFLALASTLAYAGVSAAAWHSCYLGLSGVLFALIVLDTRRSGPPRLLLGLVPVPAVWYPWALLALVTLFFPASSLLGHLSGMAAGYLLATRSSAWLLSPAAVQRAEAWAWFDRLPLRTVRGPPQPPALQIEALAALLASMRTSAAETAAAARARLAALAAAVPPPAPAGSASVAGAGGAQEADTRFPGAGAKLGSVDSVV